MAKNSEMALIAQILELPKESEQSANPEEVEAFKSKLAALEKKHKIITITEEAANKVTEHVQCHWTTKDPEGQNENCLWIAGLIGSVLFGDSELHKRKGHEQGVH